MPPGKIDRAKLLEQWRQRNFKLPPGVTFAQLEWDRGFNQLMLSKEERQALAKLSPECKYVMGEEG